MQSHNRTRTLAGPFFPCYPAKVRPVSWCGIRHALRVFEKTWSPLPQDAVTCHCSFLLRSSLKLKLKRVEHVSPQVKNLKSIFIYRQELKDNSPKSKERQKCGTFRNKCFALITACWLEHHNKHVQHHLRNRLNTFHRTTAYEKQDEQRRLTCRYVLFSDYSRL